jgi:hypothetical protein
MHSAANDRTSLSPRLIAGEIAGDMDALWFWQGAVEELDHTSQVIGRYRDSIHAGQPLPKAVDRALGALEVLLVNRAHTLSMQLQAVIPQRPGFQDQYELQQDADTDGFITSPKAGFIMAHTYRDDPLWWCFLQLLGPPDD